MADIIFSVFEKNSWDLTFIKILSSLKSVLLHHILGFRFENTEKCQNLCEVAAQCIKYGLITLESIWCYLKPCDLFKTYQEHEKLAQAVKRSFDVVVINSDSSNKDKDLNKLFQKDPNNQKLGVITELLRANHWESAKEVLDRFTEKINFTSYPGMVETFCELIEWVVDPVYQDQKSFPSCGKVLSFPEGSLKQVKSVDQLQSFFEEILPKIGIYIGFSENTHQKVSKLLTLCENKEFAFSMRNDFIFPSLSFSGPSAIKTVWTSIQDLHYSKRYCLYYSWKNCSQGLIMVKQSITV